jgi:signal transduction histidine kinase
MKLLVADDELSTRIFLKRSASKWGYEVVEATNGLEAMELLGGDNPPRIAVLDWMMPGLDGVEICARLQEKADKQMIYTILLTCKSEKEDVMYALDQGAHDFLSKPVHVGELRSRIAVGKRLIDANDRLIELDLLKDRFMGIAAHDLRNPLGYILATSEMLRDPRFVEVRENQDEYLQIMGETAERMLTLVNDLLDVSVIRSGYLKVEKKPGSITPVLVQAIRLQQHAAAGKDMRIISEFNPVSEFSFDAGRIGQVVDNLLSNAIKFSPPGSEIILAVREEKNGILVTVEDQGPGLTPEDRSHLFGEFQRLSAQPTGDEKSIGLGLTIARKIVEVHGGTIFADSPAGGGSRFGFILPLQDQTG